ncbi:MAG: hypothetical protein M1820_009704 [Bogoriella megaspora]|nr:MAG: hypothetical protein M1820_009704 [Bogoriella megaspora]
MANSARSDRVYHQDYIARIRYSNTLPPPPNPPKLLDIPNTGLSSGQYTSAGFASRLARDQPLNIEADAELGMPIDLVGLPGIFDGNEAAIQSLDNPPPVHAHDKPLLRPLASLGKSTSLSTGASFLRRSEYNTSETNRARFESSTSKDLLRLRNSTKRVKQSDVNKEEPSYILRSVIKGFDIAYPKDAYQGIDTPTQIKGAEISRPETDAWNYPRHPTNPDLQLLDTYPIIPDLDALPETGAYLITKFHTNPIPGSSTYDTRLDIGFFRPEDESEEDLERMRVAQAQHEHDPSVAIPVPSYSYDYYLPKHSSSVAGIKRKINVADPDRDDEDLYDNVTNDGRKCFRWDRVRGYETYQQSGNVGEEYSDTVILALHDPESAGSETRSLQKAAYYYPVLSKMFIRPKRAHKGAGGMLGAGAGRQKEERREDQIDAIEATFRDLDEEELAARRAKREALEGVGGE